MKAFFLAFLVVVSAATLYVAWHIWRLTPASWFVRLIVVGAFLLWTASFFFGFFFLEKVPFRAAIPLYQIGNTWLIAFLYIFLAFFLLDILSICGALPKGFLKESWPVLGGIAGAVTLLLCLGSLHYHHKYREELTITTSKPLEKPLTVVMASDLHLGYHNRRKELGRWIDLFNAENPDLVLFGGDIIDRSLRPVIRGDYAAEFKRLKAPIWSVLGNHEYYSDVERSEMFFKEAGIGLLKDCFIDTLGIRIVGRNDRSYPCRPALWEILPVPDASPAADSLRFAPYPGKCPSAADLPPQRRFTILLDHQPYNLKEAEEAGIDFQFSGHTHRGQVWPISWITDRMYEKSWGHLQRGDTRYYVSSGLGIWGAKIRIGTRSEYLVLRVNSK
ncbi:MAG: metallophosphoesterase [Bacteroidales bacterium]|nr:metallophosphoesterase [Bacteroidales bacterium]